MFRQQRVGGLKLASFDFPASSRFSRSALTVEKFRKQFIDTIICFCIHGVLMFEVIGDDDDGQRRERYAQDHAGEKRVDNCSSDLLRQCAGKIRRRVQVIGRLVIRDLDQRRLIVEAAIMRHDAR